MWTSLKQSSHYTVIQKVFGRSLVNMSVVINNSIQSLPICELNFVDQFSPTNFYYVQYTFHIWYEGHVIHYNWFTCLVLKNRPQFILLCKK